MDACSVFAQNYDFILQWSLRFFRFSTMYNNEGDEITRGNNTVNSVKNCLSFKIQNESQSSQNLEQNQVRHSVLPPCWKQKCHFWTNLRWRLRTSTGATVTFRMLNCWFLRSTRLLVWGICTSNISFMKNSWKREHNTSCLKCEWSLRISTTVVALFHNCNFCCVLSPIDVERRKNNLNIFGVYQGHKVKFWQKPLRIHWFILRHVHVLAWKRAWTQELSLRQSRTSVIAEFIVHDIVWPESLRSRQVIRYLLLLGGAASRGRGTSLPGGEWVGVGHPHLSSCAPSCCIRTEANVTQDLIFHSIVTEYKLPLLQSLLWQNFCFFDTTTNNFWEINYQQSVIWSWKLLKGFSCTNWPGPVSSLWILRTPPA